MRFCSGSTESPSGLRLRNSKSLVSCQAYFAFFFWLFSSSGGKGNRIVLPVWVLQCSCLLPISCVPFSVRIWSYFFLLGQCPIWECSWVSDWIQDTEDDIGSPSGKTKKKVSRRLAQWFRKFWNMNTPWFRTILLAVVPGRLATFTQEVDTRRRGESGRETAQERREETKARGREESEEDAQTDGPARQDQAAQPGAHGLLPGRHASAHVPRERAQLRREQR